MFTQEMREISGCRVALKRGGNGPTLLYLHGAGGGSMVQPFMNELAREWTVIAPEHPGFGASDEPAWLDNIHDLAYFYLDFIEQLDLRDLLVIGTSIGGWLALEIAVRDGERQRGLMFRTQMAETRGMIGEREVAAMRPGAFLVNTARGDIVRKAPVFAAIIALVGSKSQLVYRPLPTDDPKQRRPDTRARERPPRSGRESALGGWGACRPWPLLAGGAASASRLAT